MHGVRLQRDRRLDLLGTVTPQDRRAALRGDDAVHRVLLHEHSVYEPDRDRAARVPLPDDAGDERHRQAGHQRLGAGDRAALAVLLGRDPGVGPG